MTADEARARADAREPIESARELVFNLRFIQNRVTTGTDAWYMLNRFQREAMDLADREGG